ncbi:MAG TPA: hypothetical protein VEH04_01215 [Verrucomicrobiae bacterium]|nr:hypothetical protein [Verrucomicrobiae bacterium]
MNNRELVQANQTPQPSKAGWRSRVLPIAFTAVAAALLLFSLKLPLWHMHLEAPQYRDEEALNVAVYPNFFRGDLTELAVLNQYIGVHVPETLPQFAWMPAALIATAVLGVIAAFAARSIRSRALIIIPAALSLALAFASVQAMQQIRDIGHKRDAKTIMAGVKDFTPPFLGTRKIAQFTVTSNLSLGSWLIGSALALQFGAARLSRLPRQKKAATPKVKPAINPPADSLVAPAASHVS